MEEQILETVQAILFTELPKDSRGRPFVYDKLINGWHIGSQSLVSDKKLPAILLEASTSPQKDIAFGVKELAHSIKISIYNREGTSEETDRVNLEMARLIFESLLPHRRVWICMPCPFDTKKILSPVHYIQEHAASLQQFTNLSIQEFNELWATTHTSDVIVPTPLLSGLATDAFLKLWEAVAIGQTADAIGIDVQTYARIKSAQRDKRRPIRLLYDVYIEDPQLAENTEENQLLRAASFKLTAKELVPVVDYGPDNVPTNALSPPVYSKV